MGRKPIHTQEEVFKVADDLAVQGKEVTPNVLYEALGSRGSMTTIYRHLDAWTDQRKQVAASIPVVMPDVVMAAFTETWKIAAQEAAKEVAVIRQKADADVKASTRKLVDAIATIERLELESEADTSKIDMIERELSDTKRAANTAATEAAKREASLLATVEQMKVQLTEQQAVLQLSHEEHQAFRQDKADEVARLTQDFMERFAAQVEATRINEAELNSLRRKLDDTAEKLAVARNDANAIREEVARITAVAVQGDAEVARLTAAVELSEKTLAETRQKLDDANAQAFDVKGLLGNLHGQCEALRAQVQSQEKIIQGFARTSASDGAASESKTDTSTTAKDAGKGRK